MKIWTYYTTYWRRHWQPTPVLLPGKAHGQRSLVGCSPRGREELHMNEQLHFHFSLSCIGEGNGNPLRCSCLENPRDGGAWWDAVYGVAQSRTWLKWLSTKPCLIHEYFSYFLLKFIWCHCPCWVFSFFKLARSSFVSDFAWIRLLYIHIVIVGYLLHQTGWLTLNIDMLGWIKLVLSCDASLRKDYIFFNWNITDLPTC